MDFFVAPSVHHIIVLGAGASIEYGLPAWRELGSQIKEKLLNDYQNQYQYKDQILKWIDKVGELSMYKTLDECIYNESISAEHHDDGVEVENELFSIMKEIFEYSYKKSPNGWIQKLNEKILSSNDTKLENRLAFINYNYDHVLDDNLLDYRYLPEKHRRLRYRDRLIALQNVSIKTFCPHGTLFPDYEIEHRSPLNKFYETIKSADQNLLDAVSCFDTMDHLVRDNYDNFSRKIYIMGLGGGLEVNLNHINFDFDISEIHVTIRDKKLFDSIPKFLMKKFEGSSVREIKVYSSCLDLIDRCF